MDEKKLTVKQKLFCEYYIEDWNATRAAIRAGYSEKTACLIGSENIRKPYIKSYIEEIQKDLEKISGLSKLMILNEYKKIAFSSIAHMHNTWIELKEFERLTDDQKDCIKKIERKVTYKTCFDENTGDQKEYMVEYVKIELHDKLKSLESISKLLGYDEAQKVDVTSGGDKIGITINKVYESDNTN